MEKISKFQKLVYKATSLIPKGKVTTYKNISIAIGSPKSSRAVGNALNKNPFAPKVPCHRVIKSNGEIGGFAGGNRKKAILLEKEGIFFKNNKVIDIENILFRYITSIE